MARAADPTRARSAATEIVQRLRDYGHTAFFAGGCVRDELLGLAPTDYDVATDATPTRVRELFPRSDAVGASFGVILVHVGGGGGDWSGGSHGHERLSVEVATFRADGPYSDARRPDSIVFSDPQTDALRRDFTVNAIFLDPLAGIEEPSPLAPAAAAAAAAATPPPRPPVRGRVIDYVGGLADLHDRVIRAVGSPDQRLAEDHLRALRAVRFAARLDFTLDPATADAIGRHASKLRGVSRERIGEEVRRMLVHPTRAAAAHQLGTLGLDQAIFDDAGTAAAYPRLTALASVRTEPVSVALALAAWMADRAQAGTLTPVAPTKTARLAIVTAARRALCLSNDECEALGNILLGVESLRTGWLEAKVAVQKRAAARPEFASALDLVRAEEHAMAARAQPVHEVATRVRTRLNVLAATPGGIAPAPLVTGDNLIAIGLEPGPGFKTILDRLYDEQLEGRLTSREQGMELARGWCV